MRARLREIAEETVRIVAEGRYTAPDGRPVVIADAVARARAGTRMYGPGPVTLPAGAAGGRAGRVAVTAETTLAAARRLTGTAGGRVAALNFASARNPGGGFRTGAQAQEESLCRASALAACLLAVPEYYTAHRADLDVLYSHRVIHSPAVPVFRDDDGALLPEPWQTDFLTAAAPNTGVLAGREPGRLAAVPAVLRERAGRVLRVAVAAGCRRLVLGAWGCGVFRNDPVRVAEAFRAHLGAGGTFARAFDEVVFAVPDGRGRSPRAAFAEAFGVAG
jgi:uncharacterized protein (TIGR02452 family)